MQITLEELLDAREERAGIQAQMLKEHRAPLVCFTMNIAGPEKTSPMIERAARHLVRLIESKIEPYEVLERRENYPKSGPVSLFSVSADARVLKEKMTAIEEEHPIGRLLDIDVIDVDGHKLSRKTERGCMVCGAPGRVCAAGRLHPVSELASLTNGMLVRYLAELDAKRIAAIAKSALLDEVYTTPKPGLVDRLGTGSHTDMDLSHFERSAEALEPYFRRCVMIGHLSKDEPREHTFATLREAGLEAESAMYAATGGVNTHKGAIFSMGILCGAIGRLLHGDGYIPSTEEILTEAAMLSRAALERDLERIDGSTAGGRAYLEYGVRGIRGEAMDGFPSLRSIALPAYAEAIRNGKNKNDAGVVTLLHLIADVYDTNLYKRGGDDGVRFARDYARSLLKSGEPTADAIGLMSAEFKKRSLSPGGCADLLALTYFLSDLKCGGVSN